MPWIALVPDMSGVCRTAGTGDHLEAEEHGEREES